MNSSNQTVVAVPSLL